MLIAQNPVKPDEVDGLNEIRQIESYQIQALIENGYLADWIRDPIKRHYFFFQTGSGKAVIDDDHFDIHPGSLLVVPANALFRIFLKKDTKGLMFAGSELFLRTKVAPALLTFPNRYMESYYTPAVYQSFNVQKDRDAIFLEIEAARRRLGKGCDGAVMAYVFLLINEDGIDSMVESGQPAPEKSQDTDIFYRYQTLIEQYYAKHMSIEEYSSLLCVTRSRLIEICKKVTKMTPLEIVHKRLILEAKRELLSTSKSINEIAYQLGYDDTAYFSRFFKKQTKKTPIDYRSENQRFKSINN